MADLEDLKREAQLKIEKHNQALAGRQSFRMQVAGLEQAFSNPDAIRTKV